MRINMGKKIPSDVEQSPNIVAAKGYNDTTGLVSISGWKGHASKETPILVTVVDQSSQVKWTRLIDHSASKRNTLKVKIPRSAVHHQIVATAELLRVDDSYAVDANGPRRFTVESTSTCVAIAKQENSELEQLLAISCSLSADESTNDSPTMKLPLNIDRPSTDLGRLRLTRPSRGITRWLVTIVEMETCSDRKDVFLLPAANKIVDFEFPIRNGREYYVEAIGLDGTGGNIYCRGSTNYTTAEGVETSDRKDVFPLPVHKVTSDSKFPKDNGREFNLDANTLCRDLTNSETGRPPVFTLDELRQLQLMAIAYAGHRSALCVWLYRNKSPKYFGDILKNHGGMMIPYHKDESGDPKSPINGRIDGLFFMASVKPGSKKGEPNPVSAFGKQRVLVPAGELLAMAPKLYFTDFYCMKGKTHYVTLVMTRDNSEAEKFCSDHLLPLDLYDRSSNPFLFYEDGRLQVSTAKNLIVELFFTEDLDIRKYRMKFTRIAENCRGSSKKGGIPKNRDCDKCNLQNPNDASSIATRSKTTTENVPTKRS